MKEIFKDKRIIAGGLIGIFAILIFVIFLVVEAQKPKLIDVDHGPGDEISEKSLVFYNRNILKRAYNTNYSSIVLDAIEKVVFSDSEMEFSKDNTPAEGDKDIYYDATIDAGNFMSYDAHTSSFDVKISDDREYRVITKTDSIDKDFTYVYVAVLRKGGDKIAIFIAGDEKDKNAFVNFVKQKMDKSAFEVNTIEK